MNQADLATKSVDQNFVAVRKHGQRFLGAITLFLMALTVSPIATAQTEEIINFSTGDPATDPGTEGIAIDRKGNVYVSSNNAQGGQIWKIAPGASEPEVLATLIQPTNGAGFGVLGLELAGNRLYAAVNTALEPERNGVWQINIRNGAARHIAGSEMIALPNDIVRVGHTLYVTDTATGAIWRVRSNSVELWLQDPLLEGVGDLIAGFPLGANGIDIRHKTLYVANLEKQTVVAVDIRRGREPSNPRVIANVGGLADGIEIDRHGRPHVLLLNENALVRVNRDGSVTTLIDDAAVLDAPASLVFGHGRDRDSIYIVNFSITEGFPDSLEPSVVGPGVVRYR